MKKWFWRVLYTKGQLTDIVITDEPSNNIYTKKNIYIITHPKQNTIYNATIETTVKIFVKHPVALPIILE